MKKYHKITQLEEIIDSYEVFFFDLWGVLIEGQELYPGIGDLINNFQKKKLFVSNVPKINSITCQYFADLGLQAQADDFITAGDVTFDFFKNSKETIGIETPVIFNYGKNRHKQMVENLDLEITEDINSANVIMISLSSFEEDLSENLYDVLKKGVDLGLHAVCTNNDLRSFENGKTRYCAGFFAEKYESLGGNVFRMGKPYERIFDKAIKKFPNVEKDKILMIGDTLNTDILGASKAGIKSALVTTGNVNYITKDAQSQNEVLNSIEQECKIQNIWPTYIIKLLNT